MDEDEVRQAHRRGRQQYSGVADRYAVSESHARGDDLEWFSDCTRDVPPTEALDIACGGGFSTRAVAAAGHTVVASDLTPESVRAARSAVGPGPRWVAGAAERLPFRDGVFGLVTCRIAPHHFGDIPAFVGEVARVLTPGGTMLLVDTTVPEDDEAARWINDTERLRDPSHLEALPVSAWTRLVAEAGLRVEEARTIRKRHDVEAWLHRSGCTGVVAEEVRGRMLRAAALRGPGWTVDLGPDGRPEAFTDTKLCLRALRPAG
jgi:ubiquinone/menaquinone biosynthesis C-methylase UbiE